mgnify:CR=1 FL=1
MKVLITYDTFYGNTQKVAESVQAALIGNETELIRIDILTQDKIDNADLVILGSPTRAFNMTKKIRKAIRKYTYTGKLFWVFDTRANIKDVESKTLLKLVEHFGYAAEKMEKILLKKGAVKKADYSGYFVKDTEGPLYEDVLDLVKIDVKKLI